MPANSTAEVSLPDRSETFEVGSGRHRVERTIVPVAPVDKPQAVNWHPED